MAGVDRTAKYRGANVLAPMVRCGTLPLRLFALDAGADLVYGEELVALRCQRAQRVENAALRTVDLVGHDGRVLFRTLPERERGRVVFQVGASGAAEAVRTAELVANDVAAVDLNCGCPKKFSVSGGMGAALLMEPERVADILTALRRNLPETCGVSVKVRLLESERDTAELCARLEVCGVDAVAVHCRHIEQRTREPAHWAKLAAARGALKRAALVLNGDVLRFEDFARARAETGADGAMAARAAMWNPSVFSAAGPMGKEDAMRRYVEHCVETDNAFANTKYCLREMMLGGGAKYGRPATGSLESELGRGIARAKTYADVLGALGRQQWHDAWRQGKAPTKTPLVAASGAGGGAKRPAQNGDASSSGNGAKHARTDAGALL